MKAKFFRLLLPLLALLLGACKSTITNLTPGRMPANPSGIYTLSFAAKAKNNEQTPGNFRGDIAIDGQEHPMRRSATDPRIFEYDYTMPEGRSEASYYFKLSYIKDGASGSKPQESYSKVQHLRISDRYVVSMQSDRGPVGARIPILGRGFNSLDRVVIGETVAETNFESTVALSFIVPPLEADRSYPVRITTGSGNLDIGRFRIDPSPITLTPSRLELGEGERAVLVFRIPREAPGDLPVAVTTDIPDSVIMDEVYIPQGSLTKHVTIVGGKAGEGTLYASAKGFREQSIVVVVKAAAKPLVPVVSEPKPEASTDESKESESEKLGDPALIVE